MREITAKEVRELRERTGMGMTEVKSQLVREAMLEELNSPFWFLKLRSILRYLVQRA